MFELTTVDISKIDPNPFRLLKKYPLNEKKLETLVRSIKDVNLWPGINARPKPKAAGRYELAFGHHRLEAARRCKLKKMTLITNALTDEQMIQFMGRENLEDFNAEFPIMLETWEAATRFLLGATRKRAQAIEVARLLGWTRLSHGSSVQINDTALTCDGASRLIAAGRLNQADIVGLPVKSVREIVGRTLSQIEIIEKLGKQGGRAERDMERDKNDVIHAAKEVARGVRSGEVSQRNIRTEISYGSVKRAHERKRESPLLAPFAKELSEGIHRMLVNDKTAEKLAEVENAIPLISLEEDRLAIRRVDFALAEHGETTDRWRQRLTPSGKKVVPFKLLKREE